MTLASTNPGKLREFRSLLRHAPLRLEKLPVGLVPPEEEGLSFVENALIKARKAASHTGLSAIADDSGLEVDALHGAPGLHSARYAGAHADDKQNLVKLLHALQGLGHAQRTARFRCVLVLLRHARDPAPLICEGVWEGYIAAQACGSGGFGYDPIFCPGNGTRTSAELSAAQKNRLSHRGRAARTLVQLLKDHPP